MNNKDQYIVMNVAQNLTELANEFKKVLGDTEAVQELFANIRLLYSTKTMSETFNTVISHIAAGEEPDVTVMDLTKEDPEDPYWANKDKKPAKSYNQVNYERNQKKRRKEEKSV